MKTWSVFTVLLLAVMARGAHVHRDNRHLLTIDQDFFTFAPVLYTGQHDIVEIIVPLNSLNFRSYDDDGEPSGVTIFFVEADIIDGKRQDKGLYVYKSKGKTKLLLENGHDASATRDHSTGVYFGATDGLYTYDAKENTAVKYGSLTDDVIGIGKVNSTDLIYILTRDKVLYKVTEEGTKKTKVLEDVEQFVLDYSDNVYYYGSDKQPYVITEDGIKKIQGLPEDISYAKLLRPPLLVNNAVPYVVDNQAFIIYANGTIESSDFDFDVKPSAYAMEGTLYQFYAHNKKIYKFDLFSAYAATYMGSSKNHPK